MCVCMYMCVCMHVYIRLTHVHTPTSPFTPPPPPQLQAACNGAPPPPLTTAHVINPLTFKTSITLLPLILYVTRHTSQPSHCCR